MALVLVTFRAELFIKRDGRTVPIKYLKIDPLAAARMSKASDLAKQGFADPAAAMIARNVDVLQKHRTLASKACKARVKKCIADDRSVLLDDEYIYEPVVSEDYIVDFLAGNRVRINEPFEL